MGIWTEKIDQDIDTLTRELGEDIQSLNNAYFSRLIGPNPYQLQSEYFSSQENIELLSELNQKQSDVEMKTQISLLKTINNELSEDFAEISKLYRNIILNTSIMKAKKNDPTIMLSAIAIYNELVDVYSMRNEYESNSVYEELKNTNGETFAQIYVSALAKMDQISYDAENSESDFSDKFLDSLYYSHSEMNTLSPSSSTGYVKWALSTFLGFHKEASLYAVVLVIAITSMSLGSYDFDDFEQVLGFSVSFGFMVGYVKGLAMIYGPLMTKNLLKFKSGLLHLGKSLEKLVPAYILKYRML